MVNFSRQQSLWIGVIVLAVLIFGGGTLFSLFAAGIPIVATTAICTGTYISSGTAITQADCLQLPAYAAGSTNNNWGYSTEGEGTITLPEASKQATVTGEFRNFNGMKAELMIFNYATGVYENAGFTFYSDIEREKQLQSRVYSSSYLDTTGKIVKFKWSMSCPALQCVAAADRLRVSQFDTIAAITITSTSTTSTSTIGNASGTQGQITTTVATTSTPTTISSGAGMPVTTIVSAGQVGTITGKLSGTTIFIIVIALVGVIIFFLRKQRGG